MWVLSVFYLFCVIECMHVHASDRKLTEEGSAKFFVKADGDTVLQNRGMLNDRDIRKIQAYIKRHYKEMYKNGLNIVRMTSIMETSWLVM